MGTVLKATAVLLPEVYLPEQFHPCIHVKFRMKRDPSEQNGARSIPGHIIYIFLVGFVSFHFPSREEYHPTHAKK